MSDPNLNLPSVATGNLLDARGLCAEVALSIDAALRCDTDPADGPMSTDVAVQLVLDLRREADRLADYLLARSVPERLLTPHRHRPTCAE